MHADPQQLLNDYNEYLVRTSHWQSIRKASRKRLTPQNLEVMRKLAEWCEGHGVDARMWLYSLFACRYWTFAPPFNQLCSEKHLERFKGQKQHVTAHLSGIIQKERNEQQAASDDGYDPNRDLSGTVENLKRHYLSLGAAQVCLSDLQRTLGYHPKSSVCIACPLSGACVAALQALVPFDIQALRRGEISVAEAKARAQLHGARS